MPTGTRALAFPAPQPQPLPVKANHHTTPQAIIFNQPAPRPMPSSTIPASSRQNGGMAEPDRLAALPREVLLRILEVVGAESKRDLCSVSRLNRHYHAAADSVLYKEIQFDKPEHHLRFSQSLGRRPRRGSLIVGVRLEYPASHVSHISLDVPVHGWHHERLDEGVTRTISAMSNLEMLDIAVPDTLLHGVGSLFNGPFDLACLKSCTLFFQCPADAYWDLRENIHIFSHPTLETLVIRRARLDYRGFDHMEKPHGTALTKLHLIECDFSDDALGDVLEFPEALREFVMTQLPEPSPELEETSDDFGDYVLALRSAARSLETVVIDCAFLGGRRAVRMRDFEKLKTLRVNWDYQLFGKKSNRARLHSVGLPPELETLEFFNEVGTDDEVLELLVTAIEAKDIMARNLESIITVEGDDGPVPKEFVAACKQQGIKLDIIGGTLTEED
ncbi:hypothetical protein RB600_009111 [Gaeumannomyces tritici]